MKTISPIEKFNETINIWIKELSEYSMEQLSFQPNEGWSLGQVHQHVLDESNWYNSQLSQALEDDKHIEIEMTSAGQEIFMRGSFENKRIIGDPLISENVKQPATIQQLISDFQKLKLDTNLLWDAIISENHLGKSEHPGLGYFNAKEWLMYSEMHLRHHMRQKARIEMLLNAL